MLQRLIVSLGIACLISALAGCKGGEPSKIDRSTPRKTLVSLMLVLDERDPNRMHDAKVLREFYAPNADAAYVDAIGSAFLAWRDLKRLAIARFGRDNAAQLDGLAPVKEVQVQLERAQETVESATARIVMPSGRTITFARQQDQWLIVSDGDARAAPVLAGWAEAMRSITDRVRNDAYAKLDRDQAARQIRDELIGQRDALVAARPAPTTSP